MIPRVANDTARVNNKKIRLLIIDDHAFVRQAIKCFVEGENDLCICAEAEGAVEALNQIDELNPDLILMDLSLKQGNGLELTEVIRKRCPNTPILILSMHSDSLFAASAIKAGANGYVMKSDASEHLIQAIRALLRHETYLVR